jgi:hypothetical protein
MRIGYVLVGWSVVAGIAQARRARKRERSLGELRYRAVSGQDPAAALAALRQHGFPSRITFDHGVEEVAIVCHPAEDRERVRNVLRAAPVDLGGGHSREAPPVVFADEVGTSPSG